jgi:D-alanine-D-alanine ligase
MIRLGFVYDLRDDYLAIGYDEEAVAEFDTPATIDAIAAGLEGIGCEVARVGSGRALAARLVAGERFDLVFSIAEGLQGRSREAQVPALCELFGQPYVFSDPLTMAATLDKAVAKTLVAAAGVPTAAFAVLRSPADALSANLPFPLFVKPLAEGTGKGIEAASKVQDADGLQVVAARLIERYRQPCIAEPFLPGREFTVGIVGNGDDARVIGVAEIRVRAGAADPVYGLANKEICEETVEYLLANDEAAMRAASCALRAYRALDCRDAGRIDFRCDAAGQPMFLEANPIAGLHPTHSDLPICASLAGHDYHWLLAEIVSAAAKRYGLPWKSR